MNVSDEAVRSATGAAAVGWFRRPPLWRFAIVLAGLDGRLRRLVGHVGEHREFLDVLRVVGAGAEVEVGGGAEPAHLAGEGVEGRVGPPPGDVLWQRRDRVEITAVPLGLSSHSSNARASRTPIRVRFFGLSWV